MELLKKCKYFLLFVLLVMLGSIILFFPDTVGVADNSDYYRVLQPLGLTSDKSLKYFYFQEKYDYVKEFDNLLEHIVFIINPGVGNITAYESTQFLFLKTAQLINGILCYLKDKTIATFDIKVLGVLLLLIHCAAVVMIWKNIRSKHKWWNVIFLLVLILIYFDVGYLAYYNSFFGEAINLVGFLLWFSSVLYLIKKEKTGYSYSMLLLYFISFIILVGAKAANVPLAVFVVIFSLLLLFKEKKAGKRLLILAGVVFLSAASIYYYMAIPKWIHNVTRYHTVFYGILKGSEEPEKDLEFLGIDKKYAVLADTNAYGNHGEYEIDSDEFSKDVYEKAGTFNILRYYITHPSRLLEKMDISAEASLSLRPPYLGNYTKEASEEIVKHCTKFSMWENIRKSFTGFALPTIIAVFLIYICLALHKLWEYKNKYVLKEYYLDISARVMLLLFAAAQFIIPVVGNGEADLAKHMFLFNVFFDMMLFVMFVDIVEIIIIVPRYRIIAEYVKNHIKNHKIAKVLVFVPLAAIIAGIFLFQAHNKNDTLSFGKFEGKTLVWEIVEETDEYYFVICKDIVAKRAFSSECSNLWIESDIRKWLNDEDEGGFLSQFNNNEKMAIKTVQLKTVLAPAYKKYAESGYQPHYWFSVPGKTIQNYDNSYAMVSEERVFLLSIKEWESYKFDKKKGAMYWLRTPYTNENVVRVVGKDGYVYHKLADMKEVGVVPAMYIRKDMVVKQG